MSILAAMARSTALSGVAIAAVLVRRAVARFYLLVAVGALSAVGAGFLTAAAYLGIAAAHGPVVACVAIGAVYTLGAVCGGILAGRR
ncbi:MAG: hypothetical protein IPK81_22275 [Rhodospirillales bacterium]|nr:MAG: hypothetical protein IPK81_22275 [Rhodospirillales bacterium]